MSETKACPHCGKEILVDADWCKHCQENIKDEETKTDDQVDIGLGVVNGLIWGTIITFILGILIVNTEYQYYFFLPCNLPSGLILGSIGGILGGKNIKSKIGPSIGGIIGSLIGNIIILWFVYNMFSSIY